MEFYRRNCYFSADKGATMKNHKDAKRMIMIVVCAVMFVACVHAMEEVKLDFDVEAEILSEFTGDATAVDVDEDFAEYYVSLSRKMAEGVESEAMRGGAEDIPSIEYGDIDQMPARRPRHNHKGDGTPPETPFYMTEQGADHGYQPEAEYDNPARLRVLQLNDRNDPPPYTSIEPLEFTVHPKWTIEQLENKIDWLERLIENPELLGTEDYHPRDSVIAVPTNVGLVHVCLGNIPFDEEHEKQIGRSRTGIRLDNVLRVYRIQFEDMQEMGYSNTSDFIRENYDEKLYWHVPELTERDRMTIHPAVREHRERLLSMDGPPDDYLDHSPANFFDESGRSRPSEVMGYNGWDFYWDGYSNNDWHNWNNWLLYYYGSWYEGYIPNDDSYVNISQYGYGYIRDCYVYNGNTPYVLQIQVYRNTGTAYLRIYNSRILYIGNAGDGNWEYTLHSGTNGRIRLESGQINIDNQTSTTSCNVPTATCEVGACFTVEGIFEMVGGNAYLDDDLIVHGTVNHTGGNIYCGYANRSYDGALYISGVTNAQYNHTGGNIYVEKRLYTSGGYGSYGNGNGYYRGSGSARVYTGYDGSARATGYVYVYGGTGRASYFNDFYVYGNTYLYSHYYLDINRHFYILSGYTFYANGYTMYVQQNFYAYGTFTHGNNTVYMDGSLTGYIYGTPTFYTLRITKTSTSYSVYISGDTSVAYRVYVSSGYLRLQSSYTFTVTQYLYVYNGGIYRQTTGTTNITTYDYQNLGGTLQLTGGTFTVNRHLFNVRGYSTNTMTISGGTLNCGNIPNYQGTITHSDGTINDNGYYYENYSDGGIYYGSGSATIRFQSSSNTWIDVKRAETYFNHVIIAHNYQYYHYGGATANRHFDIRGNFTINSGYQFTMNKNAYIYVNGNITVNGTFHWSNFSGEIRVYCRGNWDSASGSVSYGTHAYFDGSANRNITTGGNHHFNYLNVSKGSSSYGMTLNGNVRCTHLILNTGFYQIGGYTHTSTGVYYGYSGSQIRMTSGTMNINGASTGFSYASFYMASGATSNITGGNIYIPGYGNSNRAMQINGTFNPSGGTVHFTGSTNPVYVLGSGTLNFCHLNINRSSTTAQVRLQRAITTTGNLTINEGVLNAQGYQITCAGNWTNNRTFTHGSNTVVFNGGNATITTGGSGSGKRFYDLNITGATKTLAGELGVDRNITISGTMAQGEFTAYIGGSWNSSSGTVTVNAGTRTYFDGSTTPVTISASSSARHFGYLTPNKSSTTNVVNMANSFRCYRCEPYRGVFNMNGYTLTCDTYFLVNYDNNDSPLDATVNIGTGRIDAPSGFQIRRGGKVTMSSGTINCGYFIVYEGSNDGIMEMNGGTINMTVSYTHLTLPTKRIV